MFSLWKLESDCFSGDVDAQVDCLVAGFEICGERFSTWQESRDALKEFLRTQDRQAEGDAGRWCQQREEFSERITAAIASFDRELELEYDEHNRTSIQTLTPGTNIMAVTNAKSPQRKAKKRPSKVGILRGIKLNDHGVVTAGGQTTEIPTPKTWKAKIELRVAEVRKGRVYWGFHFGLIDAQSSAPISINGESEKDLDDGTAAAVNRGIRFFEEQKERHPNRKKVSDSCIEKLKEYAANHGIPETQEEATAKESKASASSQTFENWKAVLSQNCDIEEFTDAQMLDWFEDGMSIVEVAAEIKGARAAANNTIKNSELDGEMDLRDDDRVDYDILVPAPINNVLPSPDNPRQHFEANALKSLAESLKKHGQQQPILCWLNHDGKMEIIDGERRYRAAKLAKLKTVNIILEDIEESEAIELRGVANLQREDLTPVEEALWRQQLLDRCNFTQRALAKRLNLSQAKLAESLALLKLPQAWQDLLTTQVITPTMARLVGPWRDRENVLEKIREELTHWQQGSGSVGADAGEPITTSGFNAMVNTAVEKCSKPIESWSCSFRVTDKNRDELDILEVVGCYGAKSKRAFNVEKWKELEKAAKARKKKTEAKKGSPAKKQNKPELNWNQLNDISRHCNLWVHRQIAERVAALPKKEKLLPLRLFLLLAPTERCFEELQSESADYLVAIDPKASGVDPKYHIKGNGHGKPFWNLLRGLNSQNRDQVIRDTVLKILRSAHDGYAGDSVPEPLLFTIAEELGVDLGAFVPDAKLLEIYDIEQLRKMPAAVRLDMEAGGGKRLREMKKPDLIAELIVTWQPGEFPPGWWPEGIER